MANLRTAFVQAYHSGNPFFFFLTGLPCILQSLLTCEDKSPHQGKEPIRSSQQKKYNKFHKIKSELNDKLHNSLYYNKLQLSTLHEIMNNESCDFKNQKDNGSFTHAIQLLQEDDNQLQYNDIETICSEYQSQMGQIPDSTEISAMSEMNCSDIEDYELA